MIPSRKIIPILLACVVAVIGIVYARQAGQRSVVNNEISGALVAAPQADFSTSTIANLLSFETNTGEPENTLSQTVTANLSRDLFASFIFAKDQGLSLNKNNIEALVQSAAAQSRSVVTGQNVYRVEDFKIKQSSASQTLTDLAQYASEIITIFNQTPRSKAINEIEVITRAATTNDPEELRKIDTVISSYRGTVNDLLNVSVPTIALLVHFDFVNSINNLANDLEQMKSFGTDPAVAVIGLNAYSSDLDYLNQATIGFIELMNQYDIDTSAQ